METIYLNATLLCRRPNNVVDLQAYREKKALMTEGTVLPEPALDWELPEPEPVQEESQGRLQFWKDWADALAAVMLSASALLALVALL